MSWSTGTKFADIFTFQCFQSISKENRKIRLRSKKGDKTLIPSVSSRNKSGKKINYVDPQFILQPPKTIPVPGNYSRKV